MRSDTVAPAGVPLLRDRPIRHGERWIYCAGFNVDESLTSTGRIDVELADLARLLSAGARVAILSHQGRHRDGSARHLDHVAGYLADRLGRPVGYLPDNDTPDAAAIAGAMPEGTAVVFGNTRWHAGEEAGDPALARRFAALGDLVAVGGFSKAHRSHASSTGILRYRPGWLTDGVLGELARLEPWANPAGRRSIAVLGGLKPEKTLVGLAALSRRYDVVVPGGVVLTTILRARGVDVADSDLGEQPQRCLRAAHRALSDGTATVVLPERVIVARRGRTGYGPGIAVPVEHGVPAGHAIVDFEVPPRWRDILAGHAAAGARCVVAGTPSRYLDGHRTASEAVLDVVGRPGAETLLMGGDTVRELPWDGPTSTGGGSALHYLAHGSTPVIDELRATTTHEDNT
ncbi:phosphoglycerate kinase [Actinoplanes sp. NPDC023714]|uniref:phosphoglycerate kinase n=1 Tax=Actinoplanes sp. NPDC023714 TaxID=3154322 RepID=UPI0033C390E5